MKILWTTNGFVSEEENYCVQSLLNEKFCWETLEYNVLAA